jgi:hypothetical protein
METPKGTSEFYGFWRSHDCMSRGIKRLYWRAQATLLTFLSIDWSSVAQSMRRSDDTRLCEGIFNDTLMPVSDNLCHANAARRKSHQNSAARYLYYSHGDMVFHTSDVRVEECVGLALAGFQSTTE